MKRSARPVSTADASVTARQSGRWPLWALFALILAATLAAYFPALTGDFLWDDAGHVTNPALQSWSGLMRIWFEPGTTQQYYPLLHTAFWLEHGIWGDVSIGYHLINVLWHATSACLLVVILRRLAVPGALLAGLIFALHPVCVESVAWISEQKNTLSTVFYLAALLAWLRFEEERRPASYAIATLWFVAALLTKTVTATLPGALLVVIWWRRGRLSWRSDVLPLLPWFFLGVVGGLGTAWFERAQIGATGAEFTLGALERGLLAGRVVWFYFGKLLWPAGLTFFYPRWTIDATVFWQWLFPVAALVLLGGLFWLRHRSRAPLTAALLFGGALFPVLGFVNVYPFVFSYVADHFQYLAALGMIAFLTAAAMRGFERLAWSRARGTAMAIGVLLILGGLTWRQCGMYRDVFVLYETTLARNPTSWAAQLNLGTSLDEGGETEKSLPHLQRALQLKPDHPETLNSLGNVLNKLGRSDEALPLLELAVQIQPRFDKAHNTLGVSLMALGRSEHSIAEFRRAVELNPKLVLARVNLGWAFANGNRVSEAIAQFEQAGRLQSDSPDLEFKWGLTLAMQGRTAEAVPHFSRAVELQPDQVEMRYALGRALLEIGRQGDAIEQLEETLSLNPTHAGARETLDGLRRPDSTRP
jgi:tetratricopeptide (TPR) repeat protein